MEGRKVAKLGIKGGRGGGEVWAAIISTSQEGGRGGLSVAVSLIVAHFSPIHGQVPAPLPPPKKIIFLANSVKILANQSSSWDD